MKFSCFFVVLFLFFSTAKAQEINAKPGFFTTKFFQNNNQITKDNFENILSKNTEAFDKWTKARKQENLWWTFAAIEGGFAVWFFSVNGNADKMITPAIGMVSSFAIGSVFFFKSNNLKKKAILTYNKQFDGKTTYSLVPIGNQNGLGLAIRF